MHYFFSKLVYYFSKLVYYFSKLVGDSDRPIIFINSKIHFYFFQNFVQLNVMKIKNSAMQKLILGLVKLLLLNIAYQLIQIKPIIVLIIAQSYVMEKMKFCVQERLTLPQDVKLKIGATQEVCFFLIQGVPIWVKYISKMYYLVLHGFIFGARHFSIIKCVAKMKPQ